MHHHKSQTGDSIHHHKYQGGDNMYSKKGWLTFALSLVVLAVLLVGTGVAWANNIDPIKRNVVKNSDQNLTPQQIEDDTGGAKSGKLESKAENDPGESMIIFGKIHQDGTREPIKVFKGEQQLNVKVVFNDKTGDVDFVPVKKTKINKNNLTPQEIEDEIGALKISENITTQEQTEVKSDETFVNTHGSTNTIWHKASAENARIGWYAEAYSSNYDGGAGAESDGDSISAWYR